MFANWRQRRRVEARSLEFWDLLGQGKVSEALALFETSLDGEGEAVAPEVRAAYHFQRWMEYSAEDDREAVRSLAANVPADSVLADTLHAMQRLERQTQLAQAVRRNDPQLLLVPSLPSASREERYLEQLGEAVLWSQEPDLSVADADHRRQVAEKVLRQLPPLGELPAELETVALRLFAWASMTTARYQAVCHQQERVQRCLPETANELLLTAAHHWGLHALLADDSAGATEALNGAASVAGDVVRRSFILQWVAAAIEHEPVPGTVAWLFRHCQQPVEGDPDSWRRLIIMALGVALLRESRYMEARKVLSGLCELPTGEEVEGASEEALQDIAAQCSFLLALSFLASTRDWQGPSHAGNPDNDAKNRELLVENRALWHTLAAQILPLVRRLAEQSDRHAWRGHMLDALLAWVDSDHRIDLPRLEKFSAAIEHVQSRAARTRLRSMEAELLTKVKATDEAVDLLKRDNPERLRELKETVLDDLGDAVPAFVRAAVYMALWNHDPDYDPLPDLQRIGTTPDNESAIQKCIETVRASHTLKRLTQECRRSDPSGEVLPSLEGLAQFDEAVAGRARLAAALVHARAGNLQAAADVLPDTAGKADRQQVVFLRVYVAWRQGDLATCRKMLDETDGKNVLLAKLDEPRVALEARSLDQALRDLQAQQAWQHLLELVGGKHAPLQVAATLVRLVAWLIVQQRASQAWDLLSYVRREVVPIGTEEAAQMEPLAITCEVLWGMVTAAQGQFNSCRDAMERILAAPADLQAFGSKKNGARVLNWCRLMKVQAELAQAAHTAEEVSAGWRAVHRSLEEQSAGLTNVAAVQPYVFLISGLLTFLSTETVVDEPTIEKLRSAQQMLPLHRSAAFVERVVVQLTWRKRVIDQYWNALSKGEFQAARHMYLDELLPTLGERTPGSIALGCILADWGCQASPTKDLLHRLDVLEHDDADLSPELIKRIREYINDGEKVRNLIRMLAEADFDKARETIDRTVWAGYEEGSMPVPVAIAKLYALYKMRNTAEAQRLGTVISDTPNLATWVTDYGCLLLGYVYFGDEKYPQAAEAFGKISVAEVLGHDTDRYWAASQFSSGMQLLAVDQKEDAFEAFARSLGKRGSGADNANLAPLFIHFGVKSIESNNGSRARHAFGLIAESLKEINGTPEARRSRVLSSMGELMCRALMDEDVESLGGDAFLELLVPLDKKGGGLPPEIRGPLERSLRALAISQELRRELRLEPHARRKAAKLYGYLREQWELLEALDKELGLKDPALLTLKGAADLLFGGQKRLGDAVAAIEEAMRLGIHSHRLVALLEKHRSQLEQIQKKRASLLDLFDVYLTDGSVPLALRENLVRHDDLAALYRLNRNCTAAEVVANDDKIGIAALRSRVKHLIQYVDSVESKEDGELQRHRNELSKLLAELEDKEESFHKTEQEVMKTLAARIRRQNLETASP